MPDFTIVMRGYDRSQVDQAIVRLLSSPAGTFKVPTFDVGGRGYEPSQVDRYFRQWASIPSSNGVTPPKFAIVTRGYERNQVDQFVRHAVARIAQLERDLAAASR